MSVLEEKLLTQIIKEGLPKPELEWRFHPVRQWRFDMYWPRPQHIWRPVGVACECEGGTFMKKSRHTSGVGFAKDAEKYNEAALMGIVVIRVTSTQITDGSAIEWLGRALEGWRKDLDQDMRPSDGP